MYFRRYFVLILIFGIVCLADLNADILPVPSGTYPTIQSAIDATNPGDTVQVAPGYYPENIVFPGYDITLTAYDPNCYVETIINAERSGAVVIFNGGETNACMLRGFTITGGMEGGIRAVNSSPTIQSCHIFNNFDTNSRAAGIYLAGDCSPVIQNSSIVGNRNTGISGGSQGTGGIYCYDGVNLNLINCTLLRNGNQNLLDSAQIYCHTSQVSAINCLIWNQYYNEIIESTGAVTARYCDIKDGWPGIGNIDLNPEFVGVVFSRYDFHLVYSSPCIDSGDPNTQCILAAYDPDGDPRIHNGRIDIGADEFVDTDADWLPDWWEKKFFASSTAASTYGNPDHDAYVNHEEYSLQTNPIITSFYVNDSTGCDAWDGAAPVWDGRHGPCKTIDGGKNRIYLGDTLLVAPGIYQGYNNRDISIWMGITVKSTSGPETCIIDCQGSAEDPHGGFMISKNPDSTESEVVLEGFTIKNGYSANVYLPAGILIYAASPTIRNCIITENTHNRGPSGLVGGAGIRCDYPGYNPYPQPQIIDCEISHNRTDDYGGGIYLDQNCKATVEGCLIHHNHADLGGGAIFAPGPEYTTIKSSTIADNTSVYNYGGLDGYFNCFYNIIWNNFSYTAFSSSDVQIAAQTINFTEDPLFADPDNDDYHLKSQAGRWNPQLQKWVYDSVTSPCIDMGNPAEDWTAELWPHGKRKNLGAYGGTPEAGMSLSTEGNPADLNFDNNVNLADYYLWCSRWLTRQNFLHEDFNRNGMVNVPDAWIFSENWLWPGTSLLAHWSMDETTGDLAHDSSVFGVHGTLCGNAAWTAGHINNAVALDGNGDYIDLGYSDILKPKLPISFAAWIWLSSLTNYQAIVSLDSQDYGIDHRFYGMQLLIFPTGTIFVSYGDGQPNQSVRFKIGATPLTTDTWYHIAVVLRGPEDIDIYINGHNDNGDLGGAGGAIAYSIEGCSYVGCRNGNSLYFCGLLDDVRIYNAALSESEIQNLAAN